jgi:hypothetical protein
MHSSRTMALVSLILLTAASRLIPAELRPWNLTAVGAICLFGGAYFQRRWAAFAVPLTALLLSDIVLAATLYGFASLTQVWFSYVLFALTVQLGTALRQRVSFLGVTAAAVAASAMFFVLSNFQVWLFGYHTYPYTPAGLVACYVAAIPFAQNMLLGNLLYCGLLFGGWELLARGLPVLRRPAAGEYAISR